LYQLLQKNITNITILIKLLNILDIVLILTIKLYCMLLSYNSDMLNIIKSYIKCYIHIEYNKFLQNYQLLINKNYVL
jgi:hypothetical protein